MGSTTRMVSARERARAAAAAFRERERALEDLAVEFFTAVDQTEKVIEIRDREIAAAESKAERAAAVSVEAGDVAIRRMLALDVSQSEVRSRLGCSAADVRRA
ncbi:hypothetical protein, partial [Plantibacter sp. CFBP 8804]|uniref:hypothetical protein n=1 Tax=Plantibacter sp. CFBP 8804 TaxID=2775270 RepID=UPI001782414B